MHRSGTSAGTSTRFSCSSHSCQRDRCGASWSDYCWPHGPGYSSRPSIEKSGNKRRMRSREMSSHTPPSIDKDSYAATVRRSTAFTSEAGSQCGATTDVNLPVPPFFCQVGHTAVEGELMAGDCHNGGKKLKGCPSRRTAPSPQAVAGYSTLCNPVNTVIAENLGDNSETPTKVLDPSAPTASRATANGGSWPVTPPILKGGLVTLRFASPASRKSDFTQTVDSHAEVLKRLEREHRRRCGRALYVLQQIQPDPLRPHRPSDHHDVYLRNLLAHDDNFVFSRVKGEVRDDGVQWLSV
ncbi:hypothetical protein, conserved [Trypanosoma brucei brucei TREU927]|uniref:Uncharacterized protein n=1 Tax=Trypanosoma brucei brucei (strain 927/4 GUTat10.1) TaxID=185431 RepID=Q385D1_TRYB2|nr:hypothetical protein, conserved [Trypanosoma brucei brucei TREU927]EAN79600.1 hypothetical protein, conserved [Trypanosoma brucei brucei TREU927]